MIKMEIENVVYSENLKRTEMLFSKKPNYTIQLYLL